MRFPRPMEPILVRDAYQSGRPNSIGFLRWVFASAVIVYHGYIVAAFVQDPAQRSLNISLGPTAVLCFFVLSGFLVARSYRSSTGFVDFLRKRALRIYPAYWFALWVTILLLAPLSWIHEHGTFHNYPASKPWRYFLDNWTLTLHNNTLSGAFRDTAAARQAHLISANASLWTLLYEFRCYVVVGVLGVAGLLWARKRTVLVLTGLLGALVLAHNLFVAAQPGNPNAARVLGRVLQPLGDRNIGGLLFAFLVGSCMALYADRVVLDDRLGLSSVAAVLLVARWHGDFGTLAIVPLCYAVLWLGARLGMHAWDRIGDPSYGVYLYGWPVEVLLAEYGVYPHAPMLLYLLASIAISTALGLLSWHLVEKQAMRLKHVTLVPLLSAAWSRAAARAGRSSVDPAVDAEPEPAHV